MREMLNDTDHKTMCKRIGHVLNELQPLASDHSVWRQIVSGKKAPQLSSLLNLKCESSIELRGQLIFRLMRAQILRLSGDRSGCEKEKAYASDISTQSIIVRGRTRDGLVFRRVVHRKSRGFEVFRSRSSLVR